MWVHLDKIDALFLVKTRRVAGLALQCNIPARKERLTYSSIRRLRCCQGYVTHLSSLKPVNHLARLQPIIRIDSMRGIHTGLPSCWVCHFTDRPPVSRISRCKQKAVKPQWRSFVSTNTAVFSSGYPSHPVEEASCMTCKLRRLQIDEEAYLKNCAALNIRNAKKASTCHCQAPFLATAMRGKVHNGRLCGIAKPTRVLTTCRMPIMHSGLAVNQPLQFFDGFPLLMP